MNRLRHAPASEISTRADCIRNLCCGKIKPKTETCKLGYCEDCVDWLLCYGFELRYVWIQPPQRGWSFRNKGIQEVQSTEAQTACFNARVFHVIFTTGWWNLGETSVKHCFQQHSVTLRVISTCQSAPNSQTNTRKPWRTALGWHRVWKTSLEIATFCFICLLLQTVRRLIPLSCLYSKY